MQVSTTKLQVHNTDIQAEAFSVYIGEMQELSAGNETPEMRSLPYLFGPVNNTISCATMRFCVLREFAGLDGLDGLDGQ